jgi:hypothetical protein
MRRCILILMSLVIVLLFVLVALGLRYAGGVAGYAANFVLANAVGPEDFELPPTPYAIPSSHDDIQHNGGQGEGLNCSLPPGVDTYAFPRNAHIEAPVSLRMRQACVAHDYCYRHGSATYGYTQADCDYILQENAFRLCRQVTKAKNVPACETDARKITLGVRVGGAGSFRRAGVASDTGRYSTYFEFDRYPLRAAEYNVIRVADAPQAWAREGVLPKAVYVFTIHRTGTRLRILGLRRAGQQPVCGMVDLPADYRFLNTAPLVLRHHASGADWLVWLRRTSLENTGLSLDGIAPATATQADWDSVFGKVVPRPVENCQSDPFASAAGGPSAFHNARVRNSRGQEVDPKISDFHPPLAIQKGMLDGTQLHLFGLMTYQCVPNDNSTCVGQLQIDPHKGTALFEFFSGLDPSCLGRNHQQYAEAVRENLRSPDCDRYRDFAAAPLVSPRDGTLGMAWLRRGTSNGEGYVETATLRWVPAKRSEGEIPLSQSFRAFKLDAMSERLEPTAFTSTDGGQQALFSASFDKACDGKLRVTRIPLLEPVDLKATGNAAANTSDSECRKDLDEDFLSRPFSTVRKTSMIFLRTKQDSVAYLGPKSNDNDQENGKDKASIDLEVAVMSTSSASAAAVSTAISNAFSIFVCKANADPRDENFQLAAVPCDTPRRARYGRPQPRKDMPYQALRAINRAPIVVSALEDDEPDIVVVHPIDVMQTVWLKGAKKPDGSGWTFNAP